MKLETVITNLNNTISGKQELLDVLMSYPNNQASLIATEVLRMNIAELRRIREDILKVKISQETA